MSDHSRRYIEAVAAQAKTGRVCLGGEMDFECNQGARHAYQQAVHIAERCGYQVRGNNPKMSRFSVSGCDLPGEMVVDWYSCDQLELQCVEIWTREAALVERPEHGLADL